MGNLCPRGVWNIPYSLGPDSFVEPGVNVHICSSHHLRGRFPELFGSPRGTLLKARSTEVLVNVGGVFSGHCLVDGGTALLATLLCESRPARPWLESGDKRSLAHLSVHVRLFTKDDFLDMKPLEQRGFVFMFIPVSLLPVRKAIAVSAAAESR